MESYRYKWREFHWGTMAMAFPFAALVSAYLGLLRLTMRPTNSFPSLASNSLIYGTHTDVITMNVEMFGSNRTQYISLGYHGFLGYLYIYWQLLGGITIFQFDPKNSSPPRDQIKAFLATRPNWIFAVFTDSGGPYWRVKNSLIHMAIQFKRPLVPVRWKATRYLKIRQHCFPLPFSPWVIAHGEPIPYAHLEQMGVEKAREYAEARLKAL